LKGERAKQELTNLSSLIRDFGIEEIALLVILTIGSIVCLAFELTYSREPFIGPGIWTIPAAGVCQFCTLMWMSLVRRIQNFGILLLMIGAIIIGVSVLGAGWYAAGSIATLLVSLAIFFMLFSRSLENLRNSYIPNPPAIPSGPFTGRLGHALTYSTHGIDPRGQRVHYRFDWGDGTPTVDTSTVDSNQSANAQHTWNTPGTYHVRVMTVNQNSRRSEFSQAWQVTIT
jgi:hypothetical protein